MPTSSSATISIVVAIGRVIKGAETFMEASLRHGPKGFRGRRGNRLRLGYFRDARAVSQPVLAVDDHPVAFRQSGGDEGISLLRRSDAKRADLNRIIWANGQRVAALGAGLHDGIGNHRALADAELQPGADEFAGPQLVVLVGKHRLQPERAGALIDLVVDQLKPSLAKLDPVVL